MTAATLKKNDTVPLGIEQLLTYPKLCADAVRPYIQAADLESYKHFLEMMYHYTFDSEAKCLYAASKTDSEALRNYFLHMAKEERGHYLLAEKDLEGFGEKISNSNKPKVVKEFDDFWYGLGRTNPNEFAGAILVFEGIADHLGKEVMDLINRLNLNKKQSRWLRVHIEADHDHGAEAVAICRQYYHQDPVAMQQAASGAATRWSAVFKAAFSK